MEAVYAASDVEMDLPRHRRRNTETVYGYKCIYSVYVTTYVRCIHILDSTYIAIFSGGLSTNIWKYVHKVYAPLTF